MTKEQNLEYKVGNIEVTKESLPIKEGETPAHRYIAVVEGQKITVHVGKGKDTEIIQKFGLRTENIVGGGSIYTDSTGRLIFNGEEGASKKYDSVPLHVAGILSNMVRGELQVRNYQLEGTYVKIGDATINPYWATDSEDNLALMKAPELFNQKALTKIGTTQQAMVALLKNTGLPATKETIEDLEYLMGEKHNDRGIKPREVEGIVKAGYNTISEIATLLGLEDDLAGQTEEFNVIAESKAIETAREIGDHMTVESLEQIRDFRRHAIKIATDYFIELDLEDAGGELFDDLDRELTGNQGLAHKLTKMVEIAREGRIAHLEQAKEAYNAWYETSQMAEAERTRERDALEQQIAEGERSEDMEDLQLQENKSFEELKEKEQSEITEEDS